MHGAGNMGVSMTRPAIAATVCANSDSGVYGPGFMYIKDPTSSEVRTFQADPRAVVVQRRDLAEVAVDVEQGVQVDLVQQLHDAPRGLRVLLTLCGLCKNGQFCKKNFKKKILLSQCRNFFPLSFGNFVNLLLKYTKERLRQGSGSGSGSGQGRNINLSLCRT